MPCARDDDICIENDSIAAGDTVKVSAVLNLTILIKLFQSSSTLKAVVIFLFVLPKTPHLSKGAHHDYIEQSKLINYHDMV